MNPASRGFWTVAGVTVGLGLAFLALGLLWVGVPWHLQFLVALPFVLAGFVFKRCGGATYPVLAGALPIGALVVQFRDKTGSHAMPVALVSAWALASLLGSLLARRAGAAPRDE